MNRKIRSGAWGKFSTRISGWNEGRNIRVYDRMVAINSTLLRCRWAAELS